jgi:uncharacterized glyoxalase superfamily protein PhnB
MRCHNQSVCASISKGNYFYVIANTSTSEKATEIFGKLSVESIVILARKILLRSLFFGKLTEKFGISWMVSFRQYLIQLEFGNI